MGIPTVIGLRNCFITVAERDLIERPNHVWSADIERHEALSNPVVVRDHRRQPGPWYAVTVTLFAPRQPRWVNVRLVSY